MKYFMISKMTDSSIRNRAACLLILVALSDVHVSVRTSMLIHMAAVQELRQ